MLIYLNECGIWFNNIFNKDNFDNKTSKNYKIKLFNDLYEDKYNNTFKCLLVENSFESKNN